MVFSIFYLMRVLNVWRSFLGAGCGVRFAPPGAPIRSRSRGCLGCLVGDSSWAKRDVGEFYLLFSSYFGSMNLDQLSSGGATETEIVPNKLCEVSSEESKIRLCVW